MPKNCDKYYNKAQRLKEEIEGLNDRIGDLNSIRPISDSIKSRITELTDEKDFLEKKRKEQLELYDRCVNDYHG